jgi:hypothetical protein
VRFPVHREDLELFYFPASRTAQLMPGWAGGLIRSCDRFQTVADHARSLLAKAGDRSTVTLASLIEDLETLARSGALVSYSQLRRRLLSPRAATRTGPPITTLGTPTRGRPDLLEKALASYVRNLREFDRKCRFLVVDDSPRRRDREHNREIVRRLARRHSGRLQYLGPRQRLSYARALARRGQLPPEVVEYALLNVEGRPVSTGACRNTLLLHTVGERSAQVDDDTVCEMMAPVGASGGLEFSSRADPTEFWFRSARGDAPIGARIHGDVLAWHEQLLGRGLADCLAEAEDAVLDHLGLGFLSRMSPGCAVRTTQLGTVGDCAMGDLSGYLFLSPESHRRLTASQREYLDAFRRRHVLRCAPRKTVADTTLCMAMCLGLDNTSLLPPFLPVERNQDGVFGELLKFCFPDAYCGFLPVAIAHRPDPPRRGRRSDLWKMAGLLREADIIELLISTAPLSATHAPGAMRLVAVGRHLREAGAMPTGDFREMIAIRRWSMLTAKVAHLRAALEGAEKPPEYWRTDIQRHLDALLDSSLRDPTARGLGTSRETAGDELIRRVQHLASRFGQLLEHWPAIVATARELEADADSPH